MSQAKIGSLHVSLGMDTAQFQAGAKRAQSTLGGLTSSLKAFAVGAAGALSLGAIVGGLRSAADHMDNLGKAAQKIGIPVEELSKLEYAARLSDVSLGDLETTLARFSKSLGEIAGGGKNDAGAAMKALGVSATDAQGNLRPTIDIMSDIAEEFSVMQDGAGKTAIAIALFGRSGAQMIPLLNGGKDAIKGAGDELQQFGGVVSEEAAVAAEGFNDNLTRLNTAGQSLLNQALIPMLPAMENVTGAMVAFAAEGTAAQQVATAISFVMQEAAKGAIFLSQAWTEVAELAAFLGDAFERLANGDFEGMSAAWAASQERVRQALEKNLELIQQINGQTQTVAPGKGDLPSARRSNPAPILPGLGRTGTSSAPAKIVPISIEDIRGPALELQNFNRIAAETQVVSFDLAETLAGTLTDSLMGFVDGTMTAADAFENMKRNLLSSLSDLTSQFLKAGLSGLLNFGGTQLGGAQGFGGFGGFYAEGGRLGAGKWGIAGENGPEVVHGPANISPMDMGGGGSNQVIVHNYNGGEVEQRERRNASGGMTTEIFFRKMLDKTLPDANRRAVPGAFGVPPSLINR